MLAVVAIGMVVVIVVAVIVVLTVAVAAPWLMIGSIVMRKVGVMMMFEVAVHYLD